ncbi:MAG TPA: hypothetical protein VEI07_01400 [Planctomycetaceae bacterium]|nr:hypothetical protein [Planctomycetaceae bacterium]
MRTVSAAIIVLAGVVCLSIGAMIPEPPPTLQFDAGGISLTPPLLTTHSALMFVGGLLAVAGIIAWVWLLRRGEGKPQV